MINDAGIALIKKWEGCRLEAYPDPASGGKPYTIGWGHTRGVQSGMKWSQIQADYVLKSDIEEYSKYTATICKKNKFSPNPNQFAALTSFCFNCGPGGLIALFEKSGYHPSAQDGLVKLVNQMCDFTTENPDVKKGLLNRRADERALFLKPIK